MLKLTTIHIDEIRRYFLASGVEEQLIIQNNISPSNLSTFLTQLKQLFNNEILNEDKLASIAKNMGAEDYLEALKEIRQDYYSHLAKLYDSGVSNPDIDTLIKITNPDFLQEVDFQKELKIAFILNERAFLKKGFQELDKESAISDDEIGLAFKLIERQQLKEQFQTIENEAAILLTGIAAKPALLTSEKDPDLKAEAASTISFYWKRLAIAASVIGLILTTTFIIFTQAKKQPDVVFNKPNPQIINMSTQKKQYGVAEATSTYINLFPSDEKQVKVLKEQSLGFAAKDEYIMVQTYYMGDSLKVWKGIGKNESLAYLKDSTKRVIDSLNNLLNKYMFKRDTLEIYLLKKRPVKLFEINAENYLQIGKLIYECKKSQGQSPLKKVTDKKTLKTIDKILFNEPD